MASRRPADMCRGVLLLFALALASAGEDYYAILGVGREADSREIRKAFKKLALTEHPDKSDDPDAQAKFIKITKAYETLKDEDKRKRYDQFGEDEEGGGSQDYQSWNYYHDEFGLYDEDPEIITLGYQDFQRNVKDTYEYWFINFYSPGCGHCHTLAPTWRRVARQLEGIIRIGAVNCQEDFMLCRNQNIRSYPSLLFFGPDGNENGRKFQGVKEEEELLQFVVENIPNQVLELPSLESLQARAGGALPWLVLHCGGGADLCPEPYQRRLVAHMLQGLVQVAVVSGHERGDQKGGAVFYETAKKLAAGEGVKISGTEFREVAHEVMERLPEVPWLDEEDYSRLRLKLEDGAGSPWLVHFVFGKERSAMGLEEKKIAPRIPNVKFGKVDCFEMPSVCKEMHLSKEEFIVFKVGGTFEQYYGRVSYSDVAEFARLSVMARTMRSLTADDFPDVIGSETTVVIDFFANWCPPCQVFLPEFRKASTQIGGKIVFGAVDCAVHPRACNQHNIRSFPTTVVFNNSAPHVYAGDHSAAGLADFIVEVIRPSVISLGWNSFHTLVTGKPLGQLWLVDYYAPWCGPCMQLASQWTLLAKMLSKFAEVKVAKVDCTVEVELCNDNLVRSYPSIRMYPLDYEGTSKYLMYTGFNRDAFTLREWVMEHLPDVVENLTPYTFQQNVLGSDQPYIVDFYAPWCGPCQQFAPVFDDIAIDLRGRVKAAKVNCERFQQLCRNNGVRAYPTVKFYQGSSKSGVDIESREPEDIVNFVQQKLNVRDSAHDEL